MNMKFPGIVKFYSEGEMANNGEVKERFITNFVEAWAKIPNEDRQEIERYCETNSGHLGVQLRDRHPRFNEGPSKDAVAYYRHLPGVIDEVVFKSSAIKSLTNKSRQYLIAHELAHLFLHVRDPNHGSVYEVAEREVAEFLVKRWGYEKDCESELNVDLFLIAIPSKGDGNLRR